MKIISKRGRASGKLSTKQNVFQFCKTDPIYFINKYVKLNNTASGSLTFKLHNYQEEYLLFLMKNPLTVAVMARQAGTTSISIALALWDAMFNPGRLIMLGSVNNSGVQVMFEMLNFMLSSVPSWLRPQLARTTKSPASLQFTNGSRITIGVTSPNLFLGMAADRIYLDNFAYNTPKVQAEVFTTIAPLMTQGTVITIASAPNGVSNMFAKLYSDAMNGKSPVMSPFKKTIHDMPQFDSYWKGLMRASMGGSAFEREYECEFK